MNVKHIYEKKKDCSARLKNVRQRRDLKVILFQQQVSRCHV